MKRLLCNSMIIACSALIVYNTSVAQINDTGGQVYLSSDQGINWQKAGTGIPMDASISALIQKGNKVIIGTDANGIYISDDRVKSWYPSSKGLPKNVRISALVTYKNILFAGTYLNGIYFSNDEGETWKPSNSGLTTLTIRSFYSTRTLLLVGTNDGIYSALNDGFLWSPLKKGVQVNSFAVSGQSIFVATNNGVFASGNFGENWDHIYKDGAINKIGAGENELYLLDFIGNVYHSGITNFIWLKADVYLPFRYTFQLTPASSKFFTSDWKRIFRNLGNLDHVLRFNGLPDNSAFDGLLYTPYGIVATTRSQKGC